ncbi:hypothetical protein MicB006_3512 [Micromonospora sp. B006]|nr:hypothetical protein MicB006_3512 [Micromonospora sp. B006]
MAAIHRSSRRVDSSSGECVTPGPRGRVTPHPDPDRRARPGRHAGGEGPVRPLPAGWVVRRPSASRDRP